MTTSCIPEPPPMPTYTFSDPYCPQDRYCYSEWDLNELAIDILHWVKEARRHEVDVSRQKRSITQIILDAPPKDPETGRFREVTLVQQIIVRGMYCSQIIRKITKTRIQRMAREGRAREDLKALIPMINTCEKWALERLPQKIFLKSPKVMKELCDSLLAEVDRMREKIETTPPKKWGL